ncbi:winged helix-turn-helix domain-containing protein [Alteromonas ponticola]|uniref:Winged helix-turn-helix domain-containing protein n=1 Tax=Alteromonas aquimaris TaxID=2998417 RepID=A0ABT3P873_9ALTE|nr:winged helix-turn-helix domain-containing protein [Alteromonas aquimaris]MCW8108286.1 winged helix-turn-helix domain-containing protein [Alteromonas aquimaris]
MKTNSVPISFDPISRTVSTVYGEKLVLSPQCAVLLNLLLENNGDVLTRSEMRKRIWNHCVVSEDMINHLVSRLRKELAALPDDHAWKIETIPKIGYRLLVREDSAHDLQYWWHRCKTWFSTMH